MQRIAIYPGSFDPVTNGHLDIVERGLKLFDKIIVAILTNPGKNFLFPLEERREMLEESMKDFSNVEIDTFDGLTGIMPTSEKPRPFFADCAHYRILSMSFRWH